MNSYYAEPVKEYLTKGVSRVALERVTQTLFKIVENIDTSENQLETQQPVQPLDFMLNQNITIQDMIENKAVTLKTETEEESQLQLVKRGSQNDEVISLSESDRNDNCILCFEASSNAVFHPCGHGGSCYSCASKILSKQQLCPLCRSPIESILKYKVLQDTTVQNKTNIQIISLSSCNRKITPKISLNL